MKIQYEISIKHQTGKRILEAPVTMLLTRIQANHLFTKPNGSFTKLLF
jgi:hypothetical protein